MLLSICLIATTPAWTATQAGTDSTERQWWKGNLHTHSFWSDGDHFPEMVVQWCKDHGYVDNEGDDLRASTERMWDIILAERLAKTGAEILYGVAADDAHNYHKFEPRAANPGQAWVVVRAGRLTPESLLRAMDAGDFYCSTGVTLKDVAFRNGTLTVQVAPEPGVTYRTLFIGTRRGYDPSSREVTNAEGKTVRTTRSYSPEIGAVLAEDRGTAASYTLQGDELYVRAKVISSRRNEKSHVADEFESAWVQPVAAE